MKHTGALMEYSQERSDALMKAYDEYISSCSHINMSEVYNKIVNTPADRFWVSDKRADTVISTIIRGESRLDKMRPLKREMYEELYRRVIELKKIHPDFSTFKLCSIVVLQPAPKFYLTPGTAKTMVCKARKEWIRRKHVRLRLL